MKKKKARTFGQDLMRGEHVVGSSKATARPGGSRLPAAKVGPDGKFPRGDLHMGNRAGQARGAISPKVVPFGEIAMDGPTASGTSIFDPVLCELAYRWFCPPAGRVLDPFAGGSVRGIVAGCLGRSYLGVDLRAEQVEANEAQAGAILGGDGDPGRPAPPVWLIGDSRDLSDLPAVVGGGPYDFVFSCPPYADLERYSDDPADLSTMDWPDFVAAYRAIISAACAQLRPHRFACFVVGDIRDKQGNYRNLPGLTIDAFARAGLQLYNDAVLITAAGSLPIRVGKQFAGARKLGKTHQNVLVFVKGNAAAACEAVGPVEFGDVEALEKQKAPESSGALAGGENGQ